MRAAHEATIAAYGRVALQVCNSPSPGRDQRAHGDEAVEARSPIAMGGERHAPRSAAPVIVKPHQEAVRRQPFTRLLGPFDDGDPVLQR